eukprot:323588-Chlamydomonas_euryale.AAC.1
MDRWISVGEEGQTKRPEELQETLKPARGCDNLTWRKRGGEKEETGKLGERLQGPERGKKRGKSGRETERKRGKEGKGGEEQPGGWVGSEGSCGLCSLSVRIQRDHLDGWVDGRLCGWKSVRI